MTPNQCDIGLIGLAVMGENLTLNMESKSFSVAAFNRTTEVTEKFAAGRAKGKNIQPTHTVEEFVDLDLYLDGCRMALALATYSDE